MRYIIALILLEIILLITNYTPNTYLVGWDNVMPEFNLWLNFKRSLFSLWQEYRGLGLVDGMAHSANLFHTAYIALLNAVFPESFVRYLYIHITHLAGGLGFFFLAKRLLTGYKKKPTYHDVVLAEEKDIKVTDTLQEKSHTNFNFPAFLGTVFYMLNIGVIQMYYAPLEVFATHFAALPILALTTYNALTNTSVKNITLLFISAIFLSPQAFVPTVFVAFLILFLFQLLMSLLGARKPGKIRFKHTFLVGLTVFLANAFWMVPYGYSAIRTPGAIAESRINQFSSEEIFYRNKARGDLLNTLTFKGFMLDTIEYDQQNKEYFDFMGTWSRHIQSVPGIITSIILSLISLVGIVMIIFKRERKLYPFIAAGGIAFFFLANNTPLLAQLNEMVRNSLPLVGEAFRFPFTKFITLFTLCMAIFFAYAISQIRVNASHIKNGILGILFAVIVYTSYPVFGGFFTSPALRLQIPEYYQQTFTYFQDQPHNRRVALLPAETFWNWGYTSWGLRGSGFIWHGIPQSLLMRPFDPWSLSNEQFYNELAYAFSIQDPELFSQILRKYDVHYLLLDESIINPLSTQPINYDEIKKFISLVDEITPAVTFGDVTVYTTPADAEAVYSIDRDRTVSVYPKFDTAKQDVAFSLIGNYINKSENPDVYIPFPSLSTERLPEHSEVKVERTDDLITITPRNLPNIYVEKAEIIIPSMLQSEFLIPVRVEVQNNDVIISIIHPTISVNNKKIPFPTHQIRLASNLENITSIKFADIDHTVTSSDPNSYSYLVNTSAAAIVISDGTSEESFEINMQNESKLPTILSLPDEKITSVTATFPAFESTLSESNVLDTDEYTVLETPNRTNVALPYTSHILEGSALTFTARNSAKELAYYKNTLYHQASYLIFINSNHEAGLPVNFYIDNPFRNKSILETKLSKNTDESAILLPKTEQFFQGYGMHVIVKSVGNETAKATISNMAIYPAPLETLKGIRIADPANPIFATVSSNKQQISYLKNNVGSYAITNPSADSIITLSQNKDLGWKAYSIDKDSMLQRWFPYLFGTKLDEVTVNNWANGWYNDGSEQTISIVFLPGILQHSGLAITMASLVSLATYILNRKLRSKPTI